MHEPLCTNCQVEFSIRLMMTRSCFKRDKTTPDSLLNPYGNPDPITVVISKLFFPAQSLDIHSVVGSLHSLAVTV